MVPMKTQWGIFVSTHSTTTMMEWSTVGMATMTVMPIVQATMMMVIIQPMKTLMAGIQMAMECLMVGRLPTTLIQPQIPVTMVLMGTPMVMA